MQILGLEQQVAKYVAIESIDKLCSYAIVKSKCVYMHIIIIYVDL